VVDNRLKILRRFPTFDFVLDTWVAPKDAEPKFALFLSQQERPRGFVLTDSRVNGAIHGTTFRLQRREAGFGGAVRPYAEGYFVPTEKGSRVYVRVQISRWWWIFSAFVLVTVFSINISRLGGDTLMLLVLIGVAVFLVSAIAILLEGAQIAKVMRLIFPT
jgi:hypothetical protein